MARSYALCGLITFGAMLGLISAVSGARAQPCIAGGNAKDGAQVLAPSFLTAWQARYPASTLPARMDAVAGWECYVCHHPPSLDAPGNCYRDDIAELLNLGVSIEDALDQLDAVDSDGDGVSNGEEAIAPRPEVGEVGYNPGLVGDLGTDPCGTDPNAAVTGMAETPAPAPIPAVSEWGVLATALLLASGGTIMLRRRTCRV